MSLSVYEIRDGYYDKLDCTYNLSSVSETAPDEQECRQEFHAFCLRAFRMPFPAQGFVRMVRRNPSWETPGRKLFTAGAGLITYVF